MIKEFAKFLKDFNVVSLAVGFVMGTASTTLVKSFVDNVLMPILSPVMAPGGWRESTLALGSVKIAYGSFLAELLNFLILALIIFLVAQKLLKMDVIKK